MSSTRDSFAEFYLEASHHLFTNPNGVYFSSAVISGEIRYGICSKGYLVVLFPKSYYQNSFSIGSSFRFGPPSQYHSELESVIYSGVPFVYLSRRLDNQYSLLSILYNLVSTNNPYGRIKEFFSLLQSASIRRQEFSVVGLFGELVVIDQLIDIEPSFLDDWQPSGQSIIDIQPSSLHPAIEVKSTSSTDSRIHSLSLHQIRYFNDHRDSLLASVQVHELQGGTSCNDAVQSLLSRLSPDSSCSLYLNQLLASLLDSERFNDASFDLPSTAEAIKYYRPDFSAFLSPPPPWVISARFTIDFSHLSEISIEQLLLNA
jgi:hypothetical protein